MCIFFLEATSARATKMKKLLVVCFVFPVLLCSAQVTNDNGTPSDTLEFSTDTIPFHYPYYGTRIPPFMGIVVGYEGIRNHCWEVGLIFHMPEFNSDFATGGIIGFAATYKGSLTNDLRTIEAEAGIYCPLSIGVGVNGNFYQGTRTIGFRPFLGTSWYHFQFLAGYNFFSKKRNDLAEIDQFTLKIRYAIPVRRLYKDVTPNPGNNY